MSAHAGRRSRLLAILATFLVVIAGTVAVSGDKAAADVSTSIAPLLQRDENVVTADNLPTVQINDGYVWAQTTIGNTVYAVGSFSNVRPAGAAVDTNLTARANILAFDITTGELVESFAPTTNGPVKSIAASPDGSRIYIGGSFNTVNGVTHYNFAALDATTGDLVSGFSPSVGGAGVYAITAIGSSVYVGGLFTQANSTARKNLAAFSATNGALLSWAPTADLQVDAMVAEPGNEKVIVGGRFYQVNSQVQRGLAALDPTSGEIITSWEAPSTIVNGWNSGTYAGKAGIFGLTADDSGVYGTGWVYADVTVGNLEGVFAADAGDGAVRWVADCHGDHYGIYSTGTTVYSTSHTHACETVSLAPEQSTRTYRYAEAFTADARGTLTTSASAGSTYQDWAGTASPSAYAWYPDFTVGTTSGLGQAGLSITGSGDYISIAGEFGSVNGQLVQGLVRFSTTPSTGAKSGPRLSTSSWGTPTATSLNPGTAYVTVPANWDRDDMDLTYELWRSGTSTAVATSTVSSTWWNRPTVSFVDSGLTGGTTQTYTVKVRDGDGNTVTSSSVSVTIASGETSAYANEVYGDGASLYYRLGGDTVDWAGTSNPVYGAGVTTTTSDVLSDTGSGASTFSGGSTGRVSSTSTVATTTAFSEEVWFRTSTNTGGKLIGYGSSQSGSSSSYDRHLYMTNGGLLVFGVYPGSAKTISSTTAYNDNAWHHAVATEGTDGIKLYVDGELVASDSTVTSAQSFTGYWRFGGDSITGWTSAPSSSYFSGSLDEAAIYPTALTASQVAAHYELGMGLTPPTAAFTATTDDLVATFDGTSSTATSDRSIADYTWSYGDGTTGTGASSSHTYSAAGTYEVTLTVTDSAGLTNVATQEVTVLAPNVSPTASFTSDAQGLTVSADGGSSSDADGSIAEYSWDWGDGADATTGLTSTHTYIAEGTYDIVLTVTDDRGGTDTETGSVTVTHAEPTADFTTVASGVTVAVDGTTSTASDAATLSYSWDWGDGTTAGSGATASHTYADAGTYTVTLTVTDSLGKSGTKSSSVVLTATTYAASDSFGRTVSSGWGAADIGGTWSVVTGSASVASVGDGVGKITLPAGSTRNFALKSLSLRDTDQSITFSASAAPATGNLYVGLASRQSASSDYTVRVLLQSTGAVTLIAQQSGTVLASKVVSGVTWAAGDTFTLETEVSGVSPTTISAKVWKVDSTEPSSWQLTTTDSTAALQTTGFTSVHFARAASATAASTVSFDDYRVIDLLEVANSAPTAAFTSTVSDLTASVDGSGSSDAEGAIASYSWSWGDGTTDGSGATASHTYSAAGTYQVTLTVTDAGGATNTVTQSVTVTAAQAANSAPTAAFTSTVSDLTASVDGSGSSDAEGAIASYSWSWGDGTTDGSGATASHTYSAAGTYQVTLTVTDAGGATNTVTQSVTVTAAQAAALAEDAFGRTASSGWGSADTGGSWAISGGAASAASVADGVGKLTLAAGSTRFALLSQISVRDVAAQVKFTVDQAPATGGAYAGVVARHTGSNYYLVHALLRTDGKVWLVAQSGTTVITSTVVSGLTAAAGDEFTLSVEVTGTGTTQLRAKVWKAGTEEPTSWQLSTTDATADLQVAGSVGLRASRPSSSTSAAVVAFDDLAVTAAD
ncbi:MAG: PKD domain-containing protein [Microbacterium sp.]